LQQRLINQIHIEENQRQSAPWAFNNQAFITCKKKNAENFEKDQISPKKFIDEHEESNFKSGMLNYKKGRNDKERSSKHQSGMNQSSSRKLENVCKSLGDRTKEMSSKW
jgi:hypothetical protein